MKQKFDKKQLISLDETAIVQIMYRPFTKKYLYYDRDIVEMPSRYYHIQNQTGRILYIQGQGVNKAFSAIVTSSIPSLQLIQNGKGFPMFLGEDSFGTIDNLTTEFKSKLGLDNQEAFSYIYGILHSKDYNSNYQSDLIKEFPRIPNLKNKDEYIRIGKKLMDLHIDYEAIEPYSEVRIEFKNQKPCYYVQKMRFGKGKDKSLIVFNKDITIRNIPEKAYEYMINGRSAIEWIIDQYQVKTDKKSGLIDDPNDYSEDPKYIFNLLLSIINVSVQTVDLVNSLPPLKIIDE